MAVSIVNFLEIIYVKNKLNDDIKCFLADWRG